MPKSKTEKVALIGAKGYVGSALLEALSKLPEYSVVPVTRENYEKMREGEYDILVNTAMPGARFWAKNNPKDDFRETVEKTAELLYGWKFRKFVQISTVSARCQLDTIYGRHKAAAEALCNFGENLIFRLGPMYSENLEKGVLVDMMEGKKVFADAKSKYCFAHVDFLASFIARNLGRQGVVEAGAKNSISLGDIAKHLGKKIEFDGARDDQEIRSLEKEFPDASAVLAFLDTWKKFK